MKYLLLVCGEESNKLGPEEDAAMARDRSRRRRSRSVAST